MIGIQCDDWHLPRTTAAGGLKARSVAGRLKLIEDLWDSLEVEAEGALPLPDWQREEIDRRFDALESAASSGAPWAEDRKRIRGKS